MKKEENLVKITLEVKTEKLISDDGTVYEVTKKELEQKAIWAIKDYIFDKVTLKKSECEDRDKVFKFNTFPYDCSKFLYNEKNQETYKHFIHHYLKNYYTDSYGSNHTYNGGVWEHFDYNVSSFLHERMLQNELNKNDYLDLHVRDLIIIHLLSGGNVRMYGNPQYYRRVKKLKTVQEQKNFWNWVIDSGMIDINSEVLMSETMKSKTKSDYRWFNHNQTYTFGELIVYKCWRDGSLEVLKWLVDEKGLDLMKCSEIHHTSKISLFAKILFTLHDKRIHETYNNGVLIRKYNYDKTPLTKEEFDEKWENKSLNNFIEFTKYINKRFPSLPITLDLRDDNEGDVEVYKNVKDFMREGQPHFLLNTSYEGTQESINEMLGSL